MTIFVEIFKTKSESIARPQFILFSLNGGNREKLTKKECRVSLGVPYCQKTVSPVNIFILAVYFLLEFSLIC